MSKYTNHHSFGVILSLLLVSSSLKLWANTSDTSRGDPERFRDVIRQIESDYGALDYRLAEQFLGLALAYRAQGDAQNVVDALRRALHVNRINQGLHHLMHVPIVDLLIDAYADLGDWAAVEQQHRFRYWIHRREVAENSDAFVDAALVFANWETRAYQLDTGIASFVQLRDAQTALGRAYGTLTANGSTDDPRIIPVLNQQALANLNLAIHATNTDEYIGTGGSNAGEDYGDIIERRNIIIESFITGKTALDQAVQIAQARGQKISHGLALANLGDWDLLFDRPRDSRENYQQAYALLQAAGLSPEELAYEFSEPRQVSSFSVNRRPPKADALATPDVHFVRASFAVTTTGKVRDVELLESNPPNDDLLRRRARARLRASTFRPSINQHGPVEARTTISYVFPDSSI